MPKSKSKKTPKTPLAILAKRRMIAGAKDHPDQGWSKMSNRVKIAEAKEELADVYNYVDTHRHCDYIR
jgi:hypothetical protein